jgi:hypothetical protein
VLRVAALPAHIESLKRRVSVFAMRWRSARPENKSRSKTGTAIRSSCSRLLVRPERAADNPASVSHGPRRRTR